MKSSEQDLPSNQKFGTFFTAVLALGAMYFLFTGANGFGVTLTVGACGVGLVTLIKDDLLSAPNQIWMRLGYLIGRIISPIILGILFFLMFTPIAVIARQFGRDELGLRASPQTSYWKQKGPTSGDTNFRLQF